ncbi:MAG: F0F1 ATP synthase subunit B [Phycisphaerales bacterium]|nr:F0F1 ATP synthase subunit B [Phycisphaerales bacterium]
MLRLMNIIAAAGEGGSEPSLMDPNLLANVTGIVVFLVALVVLWLFVWPKITQGLDDRNDKIISEIQSAEEAREQAKSALADYEQELAKAREESSRMINDARAQAKELADELRAKNEQELAERMARANADIESAKSAAVADIHSQAAVLATTIAGKILQREINPGDQQQLVEESLNELGSRN